MQYPKRNAECLNEQESTSVSVSNKKPNTNTDTKLNDTWISVKVCSSKNPVYGITVDDHGIIYFTTDNNTIYLVKQDNSAPFPIAVEYPPLASFRGILWSRHNNNLYIADHYNHAIVAYSIETREFSVMRGYGMDNSVVQLLQPNGIALEGSNLYITGPDYVRKMNLLDETVSHIAGSIKLGNRHEGLLRNPSGIAVTDDTIYVADSNNDVIRKIKDGSVETVAGVCNSPGSRSGLLHESQFSYPKGIVAMNDILFIGDDNGVRKVDLKRQVVSTLHGARKEPCLCLAASSKYHLLCGGDSVYKIVNTWVWKRWAWIGHLKELPNDCLLACLPRDIIKEIIVHLNYL